VREARKPRPDAFYLAEWIDLHAVPGFEAFVNWIRAEMDRIGPTLTEPEQANVADLFRRMSKLEAAFFETAWTGKLPGPEEDLQRI
jgi:thiaminase/transcriptional activator TenA